ncbi:MAG: IS3 family transposase [Bacteroidota bacterium]
MSYAFIRQHASEYPVALACRALGVSRSGYYDWPDRPESERARADRALTALIAQVHTASRHTYGAPRVHAELQAQGHRVARKRVARLMRQAGLRGAMPPRRAHRPRASTAEAAPDLVQQQFLAEAPDRVWCADVKQIWTREGWLYLAVVLDLYSRRVVSHACGSRGDEALVTRALRAAPGRRRPPAGLVHHSDRGSVYREHTYRALLKQHRALPSESRAGTPQDNAVVESFFATLTREVLDGARFATRQAGTSSVFEYVEVFYNRQRRHSTLDYLSPADYESATST